MSVDWWEVEEQCRAENQNFDLKKWATAKYQLLMMGMPEESVMYIMSVPDICKHGIDFMRISLSRFPLF